MRAQRSCHRLIQRATDVRKRKYYYYEPVVIPSIPSTPTSNDTTKAIQQSIALPMIVLQVQVVPLSLSLSLIRQSSHINTSIILFYNKIERSYVVLSLPN
jgi:hypothetical protein